MSARALAALLGMALLFIGATGRADPSSPAPAPAPESPREQALAHFDLGLSHLDRSEWSAALAEFLEARRLYPTRSATKNAAICLRKENRFDEALDMFEALERDYPDLTPADRALADGEIASLQRSVGALSVDGAEAGAVVVIDGRDRGTAPLAAPLRVAVGSHVVRVYKEGFVPFEQRVEIAGQQRVALTARLEALTRSGRLRVTEGAGKVLDVVVDNVVVGKTPWEGIVPPGQHTVLLRGEGNVGTQPASAPVTLDQVTPLALVAEELDASARIDPRPGGALVAIDGVVVGRGVWEGGLHAGGHRVEVTAEGFLPARRDVLLVKGERQTVGVVLDRDPTSPVWGLRASPRFVVEIAGAFVATPFLGGDLAGACTRGCSAGLPVGGLGLAGVAYQLPQGLGFGVQGGYLAFVQNVTGRAGTLSGQVARGIDPGTMDDKLTFAGLLVGGQVYDRFGDDWPLMLRLGVGVYLPTVHDARNGTFTTQGSTDPPPGTAYSVTASESHGAPYVYAAPEVRIGRRLGEHFEVDAGLQLLLLVALSPPQWKDGEGQVLEGPAGHQGDGLGGFGTQSLSGSLVPVLAPGVGGRYEF